MVKISDKIKRLTKAIALRDLEILKNEALLIDGKMTKAQDIQMAINEIRKDISLLPELMRLIWLKRGQSSRLESFMLVKNSMSEDLNLQLRDKYMHTQWCVSNTDKKSMGVLPYEDVMKLLEGYERRAERDGKYNKKQIFVNAKAWLKENQNETKFLCDYLHHLLGVEEGSLEPNTYRAESWDDDYFNSLVSFGKKGLIFSGGLLD